MAGPPINGLTDIIRQLEDLSRRVATLESSRSRYQTFGSYYRIEIQGTDAGATMHAIRTADGNDKQIAP